MNSRIGYTLANGVQVRKEVFGLLFYNYRGPKLYFVPSKDLLPDTFFNGKQSIKELTKTLNTLTIPSQERIQDQIEHLLKMLEGKELIYGQPIC